MHAHMKKPRHLIAALMRLVIRAAKPVSLLFAATVEIMRLDSHGVKIR
ncbi:MAG: hypothetical protein RBS35_05715 [Azonexus sp.]|jgi:hypothetical protein|nr:hypothetical protein [Azonexus sp.]